MRIPHARVFEALIIATAFAFGLASEAQTLSTDLSSPLPEEKSTLRVGSPDDFQKRFQGSWAAEMGFEGSDQGKDEGFASHLGFRAATDMKLSPMLAMRAVPAADFYSARLQKRNLSDDYQSQLSVDDFYLQFTPFRWLEMRAGALSQRFLDLPLLVSRERAFPGGMFAFHVDVADWAKLDVVAETVVPTSRSLNWERSEREPIPLFQTLSVHLALQAAQPWNFTMWTGHYAWSDLPSKVAFDSQIIGNEPSTGVPATAHFQYGFDGLFGGLRACYCASAPWSVELGLMAFHNLNAPVERSNAGMVELSPTMDRKFWNLKFTYAYFFNESDTTPAYYNPARYGNNNRVGQSFEAKFTLKKYQFAILAQYVDSNTINFDLNQQRLTSMLVGVETDYVAF